MSALPRDYRTWPAHDIDAASAALDAALVNPPRSKLEDALAPLEPKIVAALAANMTPTSIATLLKANGISASVGAIRTFVLRHATHRRKPLLTKKR